MGDAVARSALQADVRHLPGEGLPFKRIHCDFHLLPDLHIEDVKLIHIHVKGERRHIVYDRHRRVAVSSAVERIAGFCIFDNHLAGNRRGDLIVLQTILRILQFALGIFYALFRRFQGILDRLERIVRRLLRIGKQRCALMDIASLFHGHRRNFPAVIGGDRLFQLCGERPVAAARQAVDCGCRRAGRGDPARVPHFNGHHPDNAAAAERLLHGAHRRHRTAHGFIGFQNLHLGRIAGGNLVGIRIQKRHLEDHCPVIIEVNQLVATVDGVPYFHIDRLYIAFLRGDIIKGLVVLGRLIVVFLRLLVTLLRAFQGGLRGLNTFVHVPGVNAVQDIALFHLVALFKIRADDLSGNQGGDGVCIQSGQCAGGGNRRLDRLPLDRGRPCFGFHPIGAFVSIEDVEPGKGQGCHQHQGNDNFDKLFPFGTLSAGFIFSAEEGTLWL